jgi:hypothetical protein
MDWLELNKEVAHFRERVSYQGKPGLEWIDHYSLLSLEAKENAFRAYHKWFRWAYDNKALFFYIRKRGGLYAGDLSLSFRKLLIPDPASIPNDFAKTLEDHNKELDRWFWTCYERLV